MYLYQDKYAEKLMSATPYPIKTEDELVFSFVSEGPKGRIVKIVKYQEFMPGIYNLAFGDQIQDSNDFDDNVNSNNEDLPKIIATVMATVEIFLDQLPDKIIYFEGSTSHRTNLYHRIIKNYRHLFEENMYFYGGKTGHPLELFLPSIAYDFFIISKFPLL